MNKCYLFILLLLCKQASGQLNGSYVVGSAPSDYTTIENAINDLINNGISGPVVFNIKPGTYNEENIDIDEITGANAVNTIIFQSETLDAEDVTINGNGIFDINNGVKYLTFRHLKFNTYASSPSSANSKRAFTIVGSSTTHITISDCSFISGSSNFDGVSQTYTYINYISGHNISIINNTFSSINAVVYKNTNIDVDNFVFSNNTLNGTMYTPLYMKRINNITVEGNVYNGNVRYRSLYLAVLSGTATISRNKIFTTNDDFDSFFTTYLTASTSNGADLIFENNFLSQFSGLAVASFNNILIANNSFASEQDYCVSIAGGNDLVAFNLYNNVFYTNNETPNVRISQSMNLAKLNSDNNAFSKEEDAILYYQNSSNFQHFDVSDWVSFSGKDQNSLVVNQVYASDSDFHTPNSFLLDGNGVPLSNITQDIDGETRDLVNPDIGADEFDIDASTFIDLEIVSVVSPIPTSCTNDDVVLAIKNNSNVAVNQFDIECAINNNRNNVQNYNISISPNTTQQVVITNCNIIPNTKYDKIDFFVSNPNDLLDNNFSNDQKSLQNIFQFGEIKIYTENDDCSNTTNLIIPIMPGVSLLWSTNETSNRITVSQPGTYSVTATDQNGCQTTNSITLN